MRSNHSERSAASDASRARSAARAARAASDPMSSRSSSDGERPSAQRRTRVPSSDSTPPRPTTRGTRSHVRRRPSTPAAGRAGAPSASRPSVNPTDAATWVSVRSGSVSKIAPAPAPRPVTAGVEDAAERLIEVVGRGRAGSPREGGFAGRGTDRRWTRMDSCTRGPSGGRIVHRSTGVHALTRADAARILRAMKLVVAIVHNEDAGALVDALLDKEFRATRLSSSGGLPQAVERDDLPRRRGRRRRRGPRRSSARRARRGPRSSTRCRRSWSRASSSCPIRSRSRSAGRPCSSSRSTGSSGSSTAMAWTPPAVGRRGTWTRTFTADDVEAFAGLTGDRNPLHFDADFARRTRPGAADRPRRADDRPVQRPRRRGPARSRQRVPPPGVGLPGAGLHRRHRHRRGGGHRGPRRQADHDAALRGPPRRRHRGPDAAPASSTR